MVHNRSQPSHNKSIVYGAGGHLVTSSAFLKRSPCLLWHTTNNLNICTMITIFNSEIRTENCFESEATLVISTLKGLLILPWSWCSASSNAPLPDRSWSTAGQFQMCLLNKNRAVCLKTLNVMARHSYPLFIKWLFWELTPTDRPILISWLQHTQHLLTYWSLSRLPARERERGRGNGCYLIDQLQKFCPSIFSCSRRNLRCVSWVQWVFKSQDIALVFASLAL